MQQANVEKVENGFIITTCMGRYVAEDLYDLGRVMEKIFKDEEEVV